MIELHPHILKKNGKSEFVILPYEEFVALQETLADGHDLADWREAMETAGNAPSVKLSEVKRQLDLP